jgi:hypothetical protein
MERRVEFALYSLSYIQERLETLEDQISILEYAVSVISKRVDDLERPPR